MARKGSTLTNAAQQKLGPPVLCELGRADLPVGGDLACNHDVGALLAASRAEQALLLR